MTKTSTNLRIAIRTQGDRSWWFRFLWRTPTMPWVSSMPGWIIKCHSGDITDTTGWARNTCKILWIYLIYLFTCPRIKWFFSRWSARSWKQKLVVHQRRHPSWGLLWILRGCLDGLPTGVADYSWVKIRLEAVVSNEPTISISRASLTGRRLFFLPQQQQIEARHAAWSLALLFDIVTLKK